MAPAKRPSSKINNLSINTSKNLQIEKPTAEDGLAEMVRGMHPESGQNRAETKISARCNKKLMSVSGGIDLAKALEKASGEVGGFGGGHPVAAGASIPEGSEVKFITALDTIIGAQKGKINLR